MDRVVVNHCKDYEFDVDHFAFNKAAEVVLQHAVAEMDMATYKKIEWRCRFFQVQGCVPGVICGR